MCLSKILYGAYILYKLEDVKQYIDIDIISVLYMINDQAYDLECPPDGH